MRVDFYKNKEKYLFSKVIKKNDIIIDSLIGTINKKGAYYLIKDSADITVKYLSHLSYASYSNPITDLKGKFTQSEIIDFVGRAKEENYTNQL